MAKMQNRIAELETTRGITATNSSTDPVPFQSESLPAKAVRSESDETMSPEEPTSYYLYKTYRIQRREWYDSYHSINDEIRN
jgi:hypothetical protein